MTLSGKHKNIWIKNINLMDIAPPLKHKITAGISFCLRKKEKILTYCMFVLVIKFQGRPYFMHAYL